MTSRVAAYERVARAALLVFAAASFTANAADNDLWGHLRYGRDFLRHGVLATDPYSYTTGDHPWIEHEWGAEVVLALLWDRLGAPGLIGLKAAVGTLAVALVLGLAWETARSAAAVAVVGVPAILGLFCWFAVRPQIFTHAFFALTLYVVHRGREGRRTLAWLLPLAMVAWVNVHAGFVAGLGTLALAAAVETAGAWRRGATLPSHLWLALAGAALATTLSPYGPGYPLAVVPTTIMARPDIVEWGPLTPAAVRDFPPHAAVPLLLGLAGLALVVTRAQRDPLEAVLLGVTGALALRHMRHAPFFLLTCTWALPRHLATLGPLGALPGPAFVTAALVGVLAVVRVAHAAGSLDHLAVKAAAFPIGAVRFMERHAIGGNVAVDFNWGSYLIGRCHPRCRVSIDGRYEAAYPPAVYAMTTALTSGGPGWDRLLTDHPTDVALLDARHGGVTRLATAPGWALVYRDPVATLWLRDQPRFRPVIEAYGGRPATAPLVDDVFP
jgi:hypothetical protein